MKTRITELAEKNSVKIEEAMQIVAKKIDASEKTGKGKNTWLTEEGVAKFEAACIARLAVPDLVYGRVLREAPNRKWVYVQLVETKEVKPAMIPRRLIGRIRIGKTIPLHRIEDEGGVGYRHAVLTGPYNA